jgi:hypothetical protein
MLPLPRRNGQWTRFRQISESQKIKGLAVLAQQGYGLFAAKIWFKSQFSVW